MGSPNCGMTVRRITNVEEKEKDHTGEDATKDMSRAGVPMAARKRKSSFKNDGVVAQFRRVRILSKFRLSIVAHYSGHRSDGPTLTLNFKQS